MSLPDTFQQKRSRGENGHSYGTDEKRPKVKQEVERTEVK